jgi:hypothetical protein
MSSKTTTPHWLPSDESPKMVYQQLWCPDINRSNTYRIDCYCRVVHQFGSPRPHATSPKIDLNGAHQTLRFPRRDHWNSPNHGPCRGSSGWTLAADGIMEQRGRNRSARKNSAETMWAARKTNEEERLELVTGRHGGSDARAGGGDGGLRRR